MAFVLGFYVKLHIPADDYCDLFANKMTVVYDSLVHDGKRHPRRTNKVWITSSFDDISTSNL